MTSTITAHRPSRFKIFHKLMQKKVRHILLLSTSYEAWIMEEDCRLSEQIVNEYRGLNLSHPPHLTWVSSIDEALEQIKIINFDLVITISRTIDSPMSRAGDRIKEKKPDMPVVLLTHQEVLPETYAKFALPSRVDQTFYWSGDARILLATIKCIEDRLNVSNDTRCAGIRVIILVDDSPFYRSAILPILYKELVAETQAVIEDGLNEEHRILTMRARPKILLVDTHEKAMQAYEQFKPFVLGIISDVRFPYNGVLDANAGLKLLRYIKQDRFDIPLLLISSEPHNAASASDIPAVFIDKNSPRLNEQIASFLKDHLGFGPFIFKMPDGTQLGKATDLFGLEQALMQIPDPAFIHHCRQNDFSRWLFSLAEVELANRLRPLRNTDFESVDTHRRHLIKMIQEKRRDRLQGVIVDFEKERFDPETGFLKIGKGSLGGKARGQAFISALMHRSVSLFQSFSGIDIFVPQTLVITTEEFDEFIRRNQLEDIVQEHLTDEQTADRFMAAEFQAPLVSQLNAFLETKKYPLAVRSSSLLEDAQFKPYAGLYKTFFLANDHEDLDCRVSQLLDAIKMVYASTYYKAPRAYTRRVGNRTENEKMAVIIQQVVGTCYDTYFYPAVSGVAQSKNYYPFSRMKPEDGIVNMALGLGKAVMEGEKNLRFSPRYPQILPQRSTTEDILENAQQEFYALKMQEPTCTIGLNDAVTLAKREIYDARKDHPVQLLSSTYHHADHRIRDTFSLSGYPVLTFASLLKYKTLPVCDIITTLLELGSREMGCPVEMEFALDLSPDPKTDARFAVLQIRPMSSLEEMLDVKITDTDREQAFCISHMALGNTVNSDMKDIVYVKPDTFDPAQTVKIAKQISDINTTLTKSGRQYVLIGPGRWGSADRWLGIPVSWPDICGVGAVLETVHPKIHAEPSHGSHFFHNIAALGINYLNVGTMNNDRLDFQTLNEQTKLHETGHVIHITCPLTLKVDGRQGTGIVMLT